MKVTVLFFSVLKDITGTESESWTVDSEQTMGGLLDSVFDRWPALKSWDQSLLLAMDQQYVKRSTILVENAEIAIMPPVQGG